jgi:hypothetical protein
MPDQGIVATFMHELGHVFGLRHSFALKEEKNAIRYGGVTRDISIMSYGRQCFHVSEDTQELEQLYKDVWSGTEMLGRYEVELIERKR